MPKPVLFLAFANDRKQYLRGLPAELAAVRDALNAAEQMDVCEIVERANVTVDDIFDVFQDRRYAGRIAVFHYGGHADDYELLLESANGGDNQLASADGLVPFLSRQRGLSLAFLNGCCTQKQGEDLIAAGIPAVVCTYREVNDTVARSLAERFYNGLGQGNTLEQSWFDAVDHIKTTNGNAENQKSQSNPESQNNQSTSENQGNQKNQENHSSDSVDQISTPENHSNQTNQKNHSSDNVDRAIGRIADSAAFNSRFPWDLHIRAGSEDIRQFSLPLLAQMPLFGLPEVLQKFDLPDVPYRFLDRYRRADAPVFFGRGGVIRDLFNRVASPHASPVILLHGQSGVGKSSLLEAGLLPRLEAVADVRYIRRDPERGLLATLLDALGNPTDDAERRDERVLEIEKNIQELSATLDKLTPSVSEQIQRVLENLERDRDRLMHATDVLSDNLILKNWKKQENLSESGKIVILLDQVEEVFTRPNPALPNELNDFLTVVQQLFFHPEERPSGKLILSYRKEFDANFEKALAAFRIPKEKVFLDKLDRHGVVEVVKGLTTTERLRQKYNLTVESGLAEEMANDLLLDADSPVATVLQIVLTKIWQKEVVKTHRSFRLDAYRQLKDEGILMNDFFEQQMRQIQAWQSDIKQEVESSGLALDILNFHTTERGTAESRNLEDLRLLYRHRNDVLNDLIAKFEGLYLLTRLDDNRLGLAHDTLATVIHQQIRESDRPGQRALRLLNTKRLDYERNPDAVLLEEEDLAAVESGANGMRMWMPKETELIQKSREKRAELEAQRQRTRRFKQIAVGIVAVLAVISTFFWLESRKKAQVSALVGQALQEEKLDPTQAFETVKSARQLLPNDPTALQVWHDIYANNEFYSKKMRQDSAIKQVLLSPDDSLVLIYTKNRVQFFDRQGNQKAAYLLPSEVTAAVFMPDNLRFLVGENDGTITLFNRITGQKESIFDKKHELAIHTFAVSADGKNIVSASIDGENVIWQADKMILPNQVPKFRPLSNFSFLGQFQPKCLVNAIAFSRTGDTILTGNDDGTARLWSKAGKNLAILRGHTDRVLTVAYLPDGRFLTGSRDASIRAWTPKGMLITSVIGHDLRVNSLSVDKSGDYFLSASDDKTIKRWSSANFSIVSTYRGHHDYVSSVAVAKDGFSFVSGSENGDLVYWQTESKVRQYFGKMDAGIYDVALSKDGKNLYAAVGCGTRELGDAVNDPNFSYSIALKLWSTPRISPIFDVKNGTIQKILRGHQSGINAIAVATDKQFSVTASDDKTAIIWRENGDSTILVFHQKRVNDVAISPDKQFIATASDDSTVVIWTLYGKRQHILRGGMYPILRLAFLSKSTLVLTDSRGKIYFWTIEGTLIRSVQLPVQSNLLGLSIAPNGKVMLIGDGDSTAFLLNLEGHLLKTFNISERNKTGGGGVYATAFSPDGTLVALGSGGDFCKIFTIDGQLVQTIYGKNKGFYVLKFSPDGKRLFAGCGDGFIRVYDNAIIDLK